MNESSTDAAGFKETELELLRERIRQKHLERKKDAKSSNNPYIVSKTGIYPSRSKLEDSGSLQSPNEITTDKLSSDIVGQNVELDTRNDNVFGSSKQEFGNKDTEPSITTDSNTGSESNLSIPSLTNGETHTFHSGLEIANNENSNLQLSSISKVDEMTNSPPENSRSIAHYAKVLAQYENSSNPIISALINNDFNSKFHPMNLIPDTKQIAASSYDHHNGQNRKQTHGEESTFESVNVEKQAKNSSFVNLENKSTEDGIPSQKPPIIKSNNSSILCKSGFPVSSCVPATKFGSHTKQKQRNPMVWTRHTANTTSSTPGSTDTGDGYVSRVSKGGMTLISKSVYERDEAKFKAVRSSIQAEKTKYQKQKLEYQKKILEKKKAIAKQQRISRNRTKTDFCDRIEIENEKFAVTGHGNKLILIEPNSIPVEQKSKSVIWGDNTYVRQSTGNLKATAQKNKKDFCRYFSREGICEKGSACKYAHSKLRIRICQQFLLNKCYDQDCLFSHEGNDSNTPLCYYYLKGNCTNSQCLFLHQKPKHYDDPNYQIWICRQFAIGGYCERGKYCPMMHVFNCPDFEEDGKCPRGRSCTLGHPITQRTQELMLTPSNKYERGIDDIVIDNDKPEKTIISSYTIDPKLLLTVVPRGKYDIYLDVGNPTKRTHDNPYVITLSDTSDSEENDELDEMERGDDFVGL